jgi:hypothetical protein
MRRGNSVVPEDQAQDRQRAEQQDDVRQDGHSGQGTPGDGLRRQGVAARRSQRHTSVTTRPAATTMTTARKLRVKMATRTAAP